MVARKKSNRSEKRRRLQSLPRSQNPYQDTKTAHWCIIIQLGDTILLWRVGRNGGTCRHGLSNATLRHRLENPRVSIALILAIIASSRCESTVQDQVHHFTLELFQRKPNQPYRHKLLGAAIQKRKIRSGREWRSLSRAAASIRIRYKIRQRRARGYFFGSGFLLWLDRRKFRRRSQPFAIYKDWGSLPEHCRQTTTKCLPNPEGRI